MPVDEIVQRTPAYGLRCGIRGFAGREKRLNLKFILETPEIAKYLMPQDGLKILDFVISLRDRKKIIAGFPILLDSTLVSHLSTNQRPFEDSDTLLLEAYGIGRRETAGCRNSHPCDLKEVESVHGSEGAWRENKQAESVLNPGPPLRRRVKYDSFEMTSGRNYDRNVFTVALAQVWSQSYPEKIGRFLRHSPLVNCAIPWIQAEIDERLMSLSAKHDQQIEEAISQTDPCCGGLCSSVLARRVLGTPILRASDGFSRFQPGIWLPLQEPWAPCHGRLVPKYVVPFLLVPTGVLKKRRRRSKGALGPVSSEHTNGQTNSHANCGDLDQLEGHLHGTERVCIRFDGRSPYSGGRLDLNSHGIVDPDVTEMPCMSPIPGIMTELLDDLLLPYLSLDLSVSELALRLGIDEEMIGRYVMGLRKDELVVFVDRHASDNLYCLHRSRLYDCLQTILTFLSLNRACHLRSTRWRKSRCRYPGSQRLPEEGSGSTAALRSNVLVPKGCSLMNSRIDQWPLFMLTLGRRFLRRKELRRLLEALMVLIPKDGVFRLYEIDGLLQEALRTSGKVSGSKRITHIGKRRPVGKGYLSLTRRILIFLQATHCMVRMFEFVRPREELGLSDSSQRRATAQGTLNRVVVSLDSTRADRPSMSRTSISLNHALDQLDRTSVQAFESPSNETPSRPVEKPVNLDYLCAVQGGSWEEAKRHLLQRSETVFLATDKFLISQ